MKMRPSLDALPGGLLVQRGIADLCTHRHTVASCLVQIAHGRLSQAGLPLPPKAQIASDDPPLPPNLNCNSTASCARKAATPTPVTTRSSVN